MKLAPRGVVLALVAAVAACRPAGPPPAAPTGLPTEEPLVRVGIRVEAESVTVGARGPFEIRALPWEDEVAEGAAGETWTFTADGAGRIRGRGPGGRRVGPFDAPLRVRARGGAPVLIGGEAYRGGALIQAAGPGRVTAVNLVALEDYLVGVVPAEIPTTDLEAVKAQAVAARTYAIGHLGGREALGFDFFGTVADQVYGGVERENAMARQAVRETRGEIVAYEGRPILAFFHSTCGGHTAAVGAVWERASLPYLRAVSDAVPGTENAYYCELSNRFRWTEEWTARELNTILSETLAAHAGVAPEQVGPVQDIVVGGRTPSGRVDTLYITAGDERYAVQGDSIRWILRPEPGRILNSILFVVDVERDADGRLARVKATGGGWGHGIGMCQWGAIGRARAGQSYREILSAYYQGTEVLELY